MKRDLTDEEIKKGITETDPYRLTFDANSYRARPLTGIWASAPYLHNGSIRTLYDLLTPPLDEDGNCQDKDDRCRPTSFQVGSIDFDPIYVGFKDEVGPNTSLLDTQMPGNSNTGHEFMTDLSHEERMALIEYLKTL